MKFLFFILLNSSIVKSVLVPPPLGQTISAGLQTNDTQPAVQETVTNTTITPPATNSNAKKPTVDAHAPAPFTADGNGKPGESIFRVSLPPADGIGGIIDRPGVEPGVLKNNPIGLPDTNREGFNPFIIEPQDEKWGEKSFLLVVNVLSFMAPAMIVTNHAGDFGAAIMFLLQGIQVGLQPSFADENEIYNQTFGAVQSKISVFMNEQGSSSLVSTLQTLTQNLNDQAISYLNQLGVGKNTNDSIHAMANGSVEVPWVFSQQVDSSMRPIDAMLSAPDNWYVPVENFALENATDAFALTAPGRICLHTRAASSSVGDGAELVADSRCNLNDMQDKLWAVGTDSRLILRTDYGDKCVAYKSATGDDFTKPLAIYDISTPQCKSTRPVTLKKSAISNQWAIYDGAQELCLSNARVSKSDQINNGLINPTPHKSFIFFTKSNKCKSQLSFTPTPVLINKNGPVTPALTFDQLGIQIFYFPYFAAFHLAALKETYLHGASKAFAKSQYYIKVGEYQKWIARVLPVFEAYTAWAGIDANDEVRKCAEFGEGLGRVNLEYRPVRVMA